MPNVSRLKRRLYRVFSPLAVGLCAVAVLVAVGCSLGSSSRSGLVTRSTDENGGEMAAVVGGRLGLDLARGCVLLSGKPVVWPAKTKLTTDPPEIHLPNGAVARQGDWIRGGGGEIVASQFDETRIRFGEGNLDDVLACASTDGSVVVFAAHGEALDVSSSTVPRCQLRVIADFLDNSRIDGMYPLWCYRLALTSIPDSWGNRAEIRKVIRRALDVRLRRESFTPRSAS
jgi:hypothetical protein